MSTTAEAEIKALESQILKLKSELAKMRREQPPKPVANWEFQTTDGPVKLSDLFGENKDMIFISNMGKGCNYCTLWADGFNGVVPELESRAALVFSSADPIEVAAPFAAGRGWRFRLVSNSKEFRDAMSLSGEDGTPWPAAIGLRKQDDGSIVEIARDEFGEGDNFCATWHLLDLLKDGWANWSPNERL